MVDSRTNNARDISNLIRETYGGKIKVFGTDIPLSVRAAEIIEKIPAFLGRLEIDYTHVGRLGGMLAAHGVRSLKEDWADRVTYRLLVPETSAEAFAAAVTELTSGRSRVDFGDPMFFAMVDGTPRMFET